MLVQRSLLLILLLLLLILFVENLGERNLARNMLLRVRQRLLSYHKASSCCCLLVLQQMLLLLNSFSSHYDIVFVLLELRQVRLVLVDDGDLLVLDGDGALRV